MSKVIAIAKNDLRLVFSDRAAIFWMFILPIVFAVFFGMVVGGQRQPAAAKAQITLVDRDGGFLAAAFIEELESERLQIDRVDPEERDAVADPIRTLVIPEDFSAKIVAGEQVGLRLEKQPDTSTEAALVAEARILAAISRLIGRLIEVSEQHAELSPASFAQAPRAADLVVVETRYAGQARVVPGGFAQSIPGVVVMFVMLVAFTFGAATLTADRTGGRLRRLMTAPVAPLEIVWGKIAGLFAIAAVQIGVLVSVGLIAGQLFDIHVGGHVLGQYIVLLVYALAVAPLGVLLGAWFRDPDRATGVGVLATMLMAALGGCWWPIEVVPQTFQTLSFAFPTGWAMHALHRLISFGQGLGDVLVPLLVLLGYAAVFSALAARLLRVD